MSTYAQRMARADGCPNACGNTEVPVRVHDTEDGFCGHYRCGDCGHRWYTSWKDD